MLKSAFAPILTTIPSKAKPPKLSKTIILVSTQTAPGVRDNAPPSFHPTHDPAPTSAYVHLPFCRKRCHYCDFPIVALGSSSPKTADDDPRILNYIEVLCREIKATALRSSHSPPLETVFFGGGTPSLVPPRLVLKVLETLSSKFGLCSDAEISMEMDPGTFGCVKMREIMGLGVNRVSLGVQSFQDELLKVCGRAHGVQEVQEAIQIVKSCGIENWSMDLISSLPHQTPTMWEESLKLTIQAEPVHVSVYDLQVEQGTKFGHLYTPGEFPLPSENQSADFYRMASGMLTDAGYDHYEISSYCKNGYACKHNLTYWKNKQYYAFGLGSASFLGGVRFSRPKKLKDYINYVQDLEDAIIDSCEPSSINAKDVAMDVIMLSLRTAEGLDLKTFDKNFPGSFVLSLCKVYKPYVETGHVIFLDDQRKRITNQELYSLLSDEQKMKNQLAFMRLSDPDGFLLSNELISLAFGIMDP